jgi:hypothetical protein
MIEWQALRRTAAVALVGAAVALGISLTSSPASAQETIACVSNRLGLVRIVEDESQCKFWEHAQTISCGIAGVFFVFVSSTQYKGNISAPDCTDCTTGIERARFECNRLADVANLPGEYEPWLSDSTSYARQRFDDLGADGPWFNVKGQLVAASLAGLTNTGTPGNIDLYNPIRFDELGTDRASADVWTGTAADGTSTTANCSDWQLDTGSSAALGRADLVDFRWTVGSAISQCSSDNRIYCFGH